MITSKKVIQVLIDLTERHHGYLKPQIVVKAAEPSTSPLHRFFEWDDTKAGRAYRIWQARQLLRQIYSYPIPTQPQQEVQVFASLPADRSRSEEGGYRLLTAVLSDAELRQQLLKAALEEMELFEKKYGLLKELAKLFAISRSLREKYRS